MPRGHVRNALLALAIGTIPSASPAQVPAGPEFLVNIYSDDEHRYSALAMDAKGNFIVAWMSEDGFDFGVFARRFDAFGGRIGVEFRVNTETARYQDQPAVAADRNGDFVVLWDDSSNLQRDVLGQRFSSNGARRGAAFRVNEYTTSSQVHPAIAMDLGGNFVVVWSSNGQDGSGWGVFGRRFDTSGAPLGVEFQVSSTAAGHQFDPAVALTAGGGFAVVWVTGSPGRITARLFGPDGDPRGAEFAVSSSAAFEYAPALAPNRSGFVVAWEASPSDGYYQGIKARRFDGLGNAQGGDFIVNTYTTWNQHSAQVASAFSGGFVITWFDGGPDQVTGQRFTANGTPRGAEFQLSPPIGVLPALASDRVGNFTATWTDVVSDQLFARRFQGLFPAALAVTGEDDGVLEVNESFTLATSWRNGSGSAQSFQGLGTEATSNPPTLVLTLSPTANYGTVAHGALGTCSGPCFSGSLTGTRGVGHTDFSFLETIQPDVQGQEQRWFLHIGDSFTDVPRTNPFYRYVETLLHRGVTGGCGPSAFCPGAAVTREQMAAFVLAAKEGTLYAPPGCTAPMFADVPAASPFCRWIEELARRGVASGCGGGNYCPGAAVTREEMAVFVLRALDETLNPPACTTPVFNDVPANSPFCRWIEELARRGVVSGCGGGNYCPAQAVTREQMGVFISLTFGLALYGP